MKISRSEHKFFISSHDIISLAAVFKHVLFTDKNCIGGQPYKITSIYFDDLNDSAFIEKLQGVNFREKYRLRMYNNDYSHCKFEIKRKAHSYVKKLSFRISEQDAKNILNKDYSVFKKHPDFEYLEFVFKEKHFEAKSLVTYDRLAYFLPYDNIRVTFDLDLRGSTKFSSFDVNDLSGCKFFMPTGYQILELKHDNKLPPFISSILSNFQLRQSSISKYVLSRLHNNIQLQEDSGVLPF